MLPQPGDLFARRYRVLRAIGRGAMGVVYEARHVTTEQRFAIKVLRQRELDDPKAPKRFEREAKIAARLDSPFVVKIHDVDRDEDGLPFIVMELLEGRDLAAEVDARGEIPVAEALAWMRGVAEAMRVAHAAGIVHRDLKLSNVFLVARTRAVKVLDFGVASLREGDADRSTTSEVAGTPRYMAPEQLLGEPPNPASDVWAIGVMLYRILTGRFPYDAPTMAAQMLAIMDGCRPPAEIVGSLPASLSRLVERALGRTLEERFASAAELVTAIEREMAEIAAAPSQAIRPLPAPTPPPRTPGRRRVLGVVAVGAVALGAVTLAARTAADDHALPQVSAPGALSAERAPAAVTELPSSAPAPAVTTSAQADAGATPTTRVAPHARSRTRDVDAGATPLPAHSGDGFPAHL